MTNEEEYLISKMGKKTPFSVPEGYFEQFTKQIMEQLPERKHAKKAVIKQLRPWLAAVACVCVGAFVAALAFSSQESTMEQQTATSEQDATFYSDNYIEEEANYAMIDNQEIYACLLADM